MGAALVATVLYAAWPHADSSPSVAPHVAAKSPGPGLIHGHGLQRADCADWNAGSAGERSAVVAALRRNVGGATGYGPAVTLSDDAAVGLFNRMCASSIARGWLLYILYTRAAGFQSLTPPT